MKDRNQIDPEVQGNAISQIGKILNLLSEEDRNGVLRWILNSYASVNMPLKDEKLEVKNQISNDKVKLISLWNRLPKKTTAAHKIALIAYYLEKNNNIDTFNAKDIKHIWENEARERPPSDLRNSMFSCSNRYKFIVKLQGKKVYKLSIVGTNFVESLLNKT